MTFKFENVLVTGAAGFIGFQLSRRLLSDGIRVTGIDNLNPYYDVQLKQDRLDQIVTDDNFTFVNLDLVHREALEGPGISRPQPEIASRSNGIRCPPPSSPCRRFTVGT